jgi:hypothetical protein
MNRVLRPIARLFQADVLDAPLLHPRLCFYEVGSGPGLARVWRLSRDVNQKADALEHQRHKPEH